MSCVDDVVLFLMCLLATGVGVSIGLVAVVLTEVVIHVASAADLI